MRGGAEVAHAAGLHYFDLTEDIVTTQAIRTLAASAGAVMIPQNGLAPGFIGMLGAYLIQQFDPGTLWQVKLRVGALPQHPMGQLGYAVNWSPEGLITSLLHTIQPCGRSEEAHNGYNDNPRPPWGHAGGVRRLRSHRAFTY